MWIIYFMVYVFIQNTSWIQCCYFELIESSFFWYLDMVFLVENRYNIRNSIMNVINNYMHHAMQQQFQVVNFLKF
jgi:hypothetical protein